MTNTLKLRNVVLVYILGIITLGIYFIYWYVKTKREINENFGAAISTCWLLIIPIANIYWMYRYAEAYAYYVKRDSNTTLWALLFILISIITPALVQIELNKYVGKTIP
jgi:UDP-N-acetylmuramyl pentapeptide phosphotransferase/UDP-N-acetylglucosamine-1-phosphate transferase